MRICSWNILLGLRLNAVLDAVGSQPDFRDVDLFALQETSVHGGRQDAAAIAEALGNDYLHFQATAQLFRGREQGNALIWKKGLFERAPEVVSLAVSDGVALRRAERALLRAVPPQKRIAIRAESDHLRVYAVHLDVLGFTHKLEQFNTVLADMKTRPGARLTILAGDLNTFGPPRLRLWRRLRAAAHDAGLFELTHGIRRTHWTGMKLDAIYAHGRTPTSHRAWTLKLRASDHLPVFAEI